MPHIRRSVVASLKSMSRLLIAFKAPDGGAAENVLQLASALGEHGWEVELAGPLEAPIYERLPSSVRVHRLSIAPGYDSLGSNAKALAGLASIIRKGHFDLVHAHSAQAGVLTRAVRAMGGPPVIYTPHCFTFLGNPARLRSKIGLAIERGLAPLTGAIIDVSEYERSSAIEAKVGHARQHRLVRNASDARVRVEPDIELGEFAQGAPLAIVVSSLRPQKRVDVFIRALPSAFREFPEMRAAIIGNGPEEASLRRLAGQLGLLEEGRLAMFPFKEPSARYLACADLYVLSSSWESLPIGILEALACGVPQLASDVGGVSEAIGPDTGVTVPPEDPEALSRVMVELLRDPERRERMSEASRKRHRELFSMPRMVRETLAVYDAVLDGSIDAGAKEHWGASGELLAEG